MFSIRKLALIPALALAAACGRDDAKQDVDAALANDLSLAGQAQPAQQFVSPAELGAAAAPAPAPALVEEAPAPVKASPARRTSTRRVASSSTTRRRTTSTPRTTTTSTASSEGSSSGVYEAPAPAPAPTRTEVVKHTKRDAVIGAVAGGAIGAATSRDKIKGAVIGAAAGGVLGAIIGNNVDKSTRTVPNY